MDPGRVLLLLTVLFAAVLFVRAVQAWRATGRPPYWALGAASLGFALCALVQFGWPEGAFVALPIYLVFVGLVPGVLARTIAALGAARRYGRAAALSRVLELVQWSGAVRAQTRYLRALDAYEQGRDEEADAILLELERSGAALARVAWLVRLRHARRWEEIARRLERELGDPARASDPHAVVHYVRALGELGENERMLEAAARALSGKLAPGTHPYVFLSVLAYGGRTDLLQRLLAGPLAGLGADLAAFWRATALQAAGREGDAAPLLASLAEQPSRSTRAAAAARLASPLAPADPALWERDPGASLVRRIEDELAFFERAPKAARTPWVVFALTLANLAFFLGQPPGPDYERRLYELGALLVPMRSFGEDGFRVVAACFLHYGWTHLVLNTLALLYFGTVVERALGHVRTLLVYAIAGPGAFLLMALLGPSDPPRLVVGASGAIMGLVAAQLAILLRARALRSRLGRRALGGLALLLV
ncbi:MAG TPA: rhomboid family intramembrane serine protease, partial [Sandaracinaceae bacterium]